MVDWIVIDGIEISPEGTTLDRVFRNKTHEFGDGYFAVIPDGINSLPARYTIAYRDMSAAQLKLLVDFLKPNIRTATTLTVPILLEGVVDGTQTGLFKIVDYQTSVIEQGLLFDCSINLREVYI